MTQLRKSTSVDSGSACKFVYSPVISTSGMRAHKPSSEILLSFQMAAVGFHDVILLYVRR